MPADRDVPAAHLDARRTPTPASHRRPASTPSLVTDHGDTVGFLDARDTPPDDLVTAVLAAFDRLTDGAVLTVYSHLPGVEAILDRMSDTHPIEVIGSLTHPEGGTTLTLRGP